LRRNSRKDAVISLNASESWPNSSPDPPGRTRSRFPFRISLAEFVSRVIGRRIHFPVRNRNPAATIVAASSIMYICPRTESAC